MLTRSAIVAAALLVLAGGAGAGPTTGPIAGPGPVASYDKVHPLVWSRLAAADGTAKVWVYFADKGLRTPGELGAALAQVEAGYHPRAIARRRLRRTDPGLFDARDIPLHAPYVEAVLGTRAARRVESRWLNAMSVRATREQVEALAALPFITRIEPVLGGKRIEPAPARLHAPAGDGTFYGPLEEELAQMNLIAVHDQGFTGEGIIVGVLDTGFRRIHSAFHEPGHELEVVAQWDFINNDPETGPEPGDPSSQHQHGTWILGILGSYKPDSIVGGAYDAAFILCKTEDVTSETPIEEDYYVAGLEFIETNGGDMATSSLGYIDWYTQSQLNGLTATTTIGVNTATANGMYCCTAAGNEGHDTNPATSHLLAPADAFQVIAVGAVSIEGSIAGFSSDGPSADGRVKPELLACGVDTGTIGSGTNVNTLSSISGTSAATPLLAGAVACLIQARPTWTVDQMRAILFATASDFVSTHAPDPLLVRGYGIINAGLALASDCNANGVLDSQDILLGTSRDCNANGRPDECECRADFNGDGQLNVNDYIAFQTGFATAVPCADFDGNGQHNVNDYIAFQTGFALGC